MERGVNVGGRKIERPTFMCSLSAVQSKPGPLKLSRGEGRSEWAEYPMSIEEVPNLKDGEIPRVVVGASSVAARWATAMFSVACLVTLGGASQALAAVQQQATGRAYEQALQLPISFVFKEKPLRTALVDLARDGSVAIVVDRNVNPGRRIAASIQGKPLLTALATIAAKGDAEVTALQNVVYVGPPAATRKLQTIIKQRRDETKKFGKRKINLLKKRPIVWNTLTRPAKRFSDMAKLYGLKLTGESELPHDLWNAARLPDVDAPTALIIVLAQFERSFEWTDDGAGIKVVAMPESVAVEDSVPVARKLKVDEILERAQQRYPKAKLRKSGRRIKVTARVEVIETIRRMAAGLVQVAPQEKPMDQRLYSLAGTDSARRVLRTIQEGGNTVEWDAEAFAAAGIDLKRPITVNADRSTADELFKQICEPLGIGFRVEEFKVVLFVK